MRYISVSYPGFISEDKDFPPPTDKSVQDLLRELPKRVRVEAWLSLTKNSE